MQPLYAASGSLAPVEELNQYLRSIKSWHSEFIQQTITDTGKVMSSAQGELMVSKPHKFSWITLDPLPQKIISDGESLWIFDPDLEQVIIKNAAEQIAQTPIQLLSSEPVDIAARFEVEMAKIDGRTLFYLKPKEQQENFEQIQLEFFESLLIRVSLDDGIGQHTEIEFLNPMLNPTLSDKSFVFYMPDGTDVIDERALR